MNKWTYTPNPATLVDRLNGVYPSAVGPYAPSPINKEAAAEIVRLMAQCNEMRKAAEVFAHVVCEIKMKFENDEQREVFLESYEELRDVLDNKKPAGAG